MVFAISIKNKVRLYPLTILLTSFIGSIFSPVYAFEKPFQQEVLITAYYSPLPNQCCYFRGSYEEDITFNGNGTNGADGTPVYEGMLAAPSSYPFGTRIALPGLGIGTVHDRGGRITEWGSGVHRIDVWMGTGEEGLKRALAWGARRMTATVYPESTDQPSEYFSFRSIKADDAILKGLAKGDPQRLLTKAVFGEKSYSVRILQTSLKKLGYFQHPVTGEFGVVTQDAFKRFLTAYNLPGDGKTVGPFSAAVLTVAVNANDRAVIQPKEAIGLQKGVKSMSVSDLKRRLRFLGFYKGRTDTLFDDNVRTAVLEFQKARGVIASDDAVGAGQVGPMTKKELAKAWQEKMVLIEAKNQMVRSKVETMVLEQHLPKKVMTKGDRGAEVRRLQKALVTLGYLPTKDITGTFGDRTEKALIAYQKKEGIIKAEGEKGTGVFGTTTRKGVQKSLTEMLVKKVRSGEMEV